MEVNDGNGAAAVVVVVVAAAAALIIVVVVVVVVRKESDPVTGPFVAQRVGRGIALLFHDHDTRRG